MVSAKLTIKQRIAIILISWFSVIGFDLGTLVKNILNQFWNKNILSETQQSGSNIAYDGQQLRFYARTSTISILTK